MTTYYGYKKLTVLHWYYREPIDELVRKKLIKIVQAPESDPKRSITKGEILWKRLK